jgi:shikimate kinase
MSFSNLQFAICNLQFAIACIAHLYRFACIMDLAARPIFLIGYRGTGKTTVANELALRLGYESVDADDLVEKQAGKSISAIFAEQGEEAFRVLESQVLTALIQRRNSVVSLGGGAVLREGNRAVIRAAGPVVWLTAGVDTIMQRLQSDPSTAGRRPALTVTGGRKEIESLLNLRTPYYRECATLVVDTEGKIPAEVAEEILQNL